MIEHILQCEHYGDWFVSSRKHAKTCTENCRVAKFRARRKVGAGAEGRESAGVARGASHPGPDTEATP